MTVVIIGAALLAIFGRMPWPALVALGVFCAVFFGASTIVTKLLPNTGDSYTCGNNKGVMDGDTVVTKTTRTTKS